MSCYLTYIAMKIYSLFKYTQCNITPGWDCIAEIFLLTVKMIKQQTFIYFQAGNKFFLDVTPLHKYFHSQTIFTSTRAALQKQLQMLAVYASNENTYPDFMNKSSLNVFAELLLKCCHSCFERTVHATLDKCKFLT